jgi:hypothetical protein
MIQFKYELKLNERVKAKCSRRGEVVVRKKFFTQATAALHRELTS